MAEPIRYTARQLAAECRAAGRELDWFEALYAKGAEDVSLIPWADLVPNPNVVEWLDRRALGDRETALKVGCGLGDDAEELARRGLKTTAFDIAESAIRSCRDRFPSSSVAYVRADLFSAPESWAGAFDLVVESYTLQVLSPELRARAIPAIASFVAPGGCLLVVARGRDSEEPEGQMPWPLLRTEVMNFEAQGLSCLCFEDLMDSEEPPVRRFRAVFAKPESQQ